MPERDEVTTSGAKERTPDNQDSHRDESSASTESKGAPSGKGIGALLTAIACTVFGSRLIVILAFGSPVPVLDQWDGEAAAVYSPYLNGTLSFASLFTPHNEHRIVLTRLLALGHLELAGEWNTRLEMIFSAAILTAVITWLTALLMPLVAPRRRMLLSCFVALAFAFPIDFENAVWGFQSQVYLSLFFGLAALVAFAPASPFSVRWFCGLAGGIVSCFAFATGLATLPAAGILVVLQLATNARKRCRREVAAVVVMAVVTLAMVLGGAHTLTQLWTFAAGLGIFAGLTIAAGIPIFWFGRRTLSRRPGCSDPAWMMLGVSVWVAIQFVLFAYGRGMHIAPRYMVVVLLAYPMALVAVIALADHPRPLVTRWRTSFGPAAWVFTVLAAIVFAGCMSVLGCSNWAKAADQQLADVRAYLATGKVDHLQERGSPTHGVVLIHPTPQRQAEILQDPALRAILPTEIRPSDADNVAVRDQLLLKGRLAGATATAVNLSLAMSPAVLAVGIGLFFAVGMARILPARTVPFVGERGSTH